MNPELTVLLEHATGIVADGKVTAVDIAAIAKLLRAASKIQQVNDIEDAAIDFLEARAMKRKSFAKTGLMGLYGIIRKAVNCPDDDDNKTQF